VREQLTIKMIVNGETAEVGISPWITLADLIRHQLALTGTHAGCKEGECGSCTLLVDGRPLRSCLTLAAQVDGCAVETVEGYVRDGRTRLIQQAFTDHFASQCGFCTSGFLAVVRAYLDDDAVPDHGDEATIRHMLNAVACRCTGYQPIVAAVKALATKWQEFQDVH
jgi:carbon-monoxide dehydrogenase small subunit